MRSVRRTTARRDRTAVRVRPSRLAISCCVRPCDSSSKTSRSASAFQVLLYPSIRNDSGRSRSRIARAGRGAFRTSINSANASRRRKRNPAPCVYLATCKITPKLLAGAYRPRCPPRRGHLFGTKFAPDPLKDVPAFLERQSARHGYTASF